MVPCAKLWAAAFMDLQTMNTCSVDAEPESVDTEPETQMMGQKGVNQFSNNIIKVTHSGT